jgi:hypothetical protein|tara:strand:+ start:1945 stop:2163 length:219 start_codon:yes stop_codon:yes gene_type:complete
MPNSKQLSLILNKVERYIKEQIKKESMPRLGVNDDSSILDAQKDGEIIGRANLSEELLDMISDLRKEYDEKY